MTTDAALKAWETRRANGWQHPSKLKKVTAKQAELRLRALKAWETRRANQRAAKLSERAQKAWATRRARQADAG